MANHFENLYLEEINLNKADDETRKSNSPGTKIQSGVTTLSAAPTADVAMPYDSKSTLDEPFTQTLVTVVNQGREFSGIGRKIRFTFARGDKTERLHELLKYDLWGPFIFYLVFSV